MPRPLLTFALVLVVVAGAIVVVDAAPTAAPPNPFAPSPPGPSAICTKACKTVADCGLGPNQFGSDKWECKESLCHYLGCVSDVACQGAYNSDKMVCKTTAQTMGTPTCLRTCKTPSDCQILGSALHDAAHYSCDSGLCTDLGCKSSAECQAAYNKPNYACTWNGGAIPPACMPTCKTATDCIVEATPLYDADNWICAAGICDYRGCTSDAECRMGYMSDAYRCLSL